jgi:hypothetical protein
MVNVQDCRAMEMICRQRAKADPAKSWKWLGQAERWHDLATREWLGDSSGEMRSNKCTLVRCKWDRTPLKAILAPNNKGSGTADA